MKAVFEVKFTKSEMCDRKTLESEFGGSWEKCILSLFEEEGTGMFSNDFKLVGVKDDHE